jgi:hypothetical protein
LQLVHLLLDRVAGLLVGKRRRICCGARLILRSVKLSLERFPCLRLRIRVGRLNDKREKPN